MSFGLDRVKAPAHFSAVPERLTRDSAIVPIGSKKDRRYLTVATLLFADHVCCTGCHAGMLCAEPWLHIPDSGKRRWTDAVSTNADALLPGPCGPDTRCAASGRSRTRVSISVRAVSRIDTYSRCSCGVCACEALTRAGNAPGRAGASEGRIQSGSGGGAPPRRWLAILPGAGRPG